MFLQRSGMLFFLFLPSILLSQFANPRFEHLTTEHGLSQSTITSICQDDDGFLWFGTYDGLNKYDGYNFTVYRHSDDGASLNDNAVWSLFKDNNGNVWVGTRDGLNLYDHELDRFRRIELLKREASEYDDNSVRSIVGDSSGVIWFISNGQGLVNYNHATGRSRYFVHQSNVPGSLSSNSLRTLFMDSHSRLWVGSWSGHVDVYHPRQDRFEHIAGEGRLSIRSAVTSFA